MKTRVVSEPIVISPPASPTQSVPDTAIPQSLENSAKANHTDTKTAEGEYMLIAEDRSLWPEWLQKQAKLIEQGPTPAGYEKVLQKLAILDKLLGYPAGQVCGITNMRFHL